MANVLSTEVILDGERLYIAKFTNIADTDEAKATKIDVSALNPNSFSLACDGVVIDKIWVQTQGLAVYLYFQGDATDPTTDTLAMTIPADQLYDISYDDIGGIKSFNTDAAKTNDLLLSTVGAAAGDSYTLVIQCIKSYAPSQAGARG